MSNEDYLQQGGYEACLFIGYEHATSRNTMDLAVERDSQRLHGAENI